MSTKRVSGTLLALSLVLSAASFQAQAQEPAKLERNNTGTSSTTPLSGGGTTGRVAKWVGVGGSNTFVLGDSNVFEDKFGKVGIGTTTPTSLLTVQGMIETTLGGYKFPDGTIQTTAGIPFVSHDASLAGLGTEQSPLGIAFGGVQTIHLAANAVTAPKIANGTVIRSLNGLFDNVVLAAGSNITITPAGNTLTIATPNSLSSVAHDSTLAGNGTAASPLKVSDSGIDNIQLANGAVTLSKIALNQVVTRVNNLTESVTLAAGPNITISTSGNTLTIAAAPATALPVAMLRVRDDGVILSCYNGTTNSTSGNCGFTVTKVPNFDGVFRINYGFGVTNRFIAVTCEYNENSNFSPQATFKNGGANYRYFDATSIEVFTFKADDAQDTVSVGFTIILF